MPPPGLPAVVKMSMGGMVSGLSCFRGSPMARRVAEALGTPATRPRMAIGCGQPRKPLTMPPGFCGYMRLSYQ